MELTKYHDPAKNRELLEAIFQDAGQLEAITAETEALFKEICRPLATESGSIKKTWLERAWALLAEPYEPAEAAAVQAEVMGGNWQPPWKPLLDREYEKLLDRTWNNVRDVTDFGAVGDGVTDSTEAFRKAIAGGGVHVTVPAGIFVVRDIRLPSWVRLTGSGKGRTIIRLHDAAPKRTRLVTNRHYRKGNDHIAVEGLSLDWNVGRLRPDEKTKGFGNAASCLTYANVRFGWVSEVAAIDPGLHCFDLTSPLYNYGGDGVRAKNGSRFVWLDRVNGHGFGDDGVTTHHSDCLFISNSHFCDPSGRSHKQGVANSNGIEIDDGSRSVWLLNNSTARCFGGVEIKAHKESSAASGVFLSGHLSVNDNRSFNFRHIGHHVKDDAASLSAYHIKAQRLVSVAPVWTPLYKGSSPRALVVSAYRNVAINRFLFVGDPATDYKGGPAAAIQYRAENVIVANGTVTGFRTAGADLKAAGGANAARRVIFRCIHHVQSAKKPVSLPKRRAR